MNWLYALDLIGTLVFAISGVLTAINKKFDLVGSIIIGLVTAVGGGTLRDVLIGKTPVGWMQDLNYFYTILLAVIVSYLFEKHIIKWTRSMFIFDTIGIGVFTILGMQKTATTGLGIPIILFMGVVSAVFGGVIRDVLTNEVPLIFRKEIYASACLLGGIVFMTLEYCGLPTNFNAICCMLIISVIRYIAVKKHWSLHF